MTRARLLVAALAAYFVVVWGAGYVFSRAAMQDAGPITYVAVRYTLAALVAFAVFGWSARWPASPRVLGHVLVSGLMLHAIYLAASHHAQKWGLSSAVTALVLALQPLATAAVVSRWMGTSLSGVQLAGIGVGLAGVALVVLQRLGDGGAALAASEGGAGISVATLAAVTLALVSITAGTLYQRVFCADVDLKASICLQCLASAALALPVAWAVEGFHITWTPRIGWALVYHVLLGSIGAWSVLAWLMRRGEATGVTSLLYLTPPVAAVTEWLVFGTVPAAVTWLGMAVACVGVAMATRPPASRPGPSAPAAGTP
ncbi:MAG TPA: DMT family transporter [Geminicoccaceae bacterium]